MRNPIFVIAPPPWGLKQCKDLADVLRILLRRKDIVVLPHGFIVVNGFSVRGLVVKILIKLLKVEGVK